MKGTRVSALTQEDPTCHGATKPVCHNHWACALEPGSCNYWAHVPQLLSHVPQLLSPRTTATEPTYHSYWAHVPQLLSPRTTTTEAHAPRACALKPLQWEGPEPQLQGSPHSLQLEKSPRSNKDPAQSKINKYIKLKAITDWHFSWCLEFIDFPAPRPLHSLRDWDVHIPFYT